MRQQNQNQRQAGIIVALLLMVLTAVTFAGVLSNGFISFDDDFYVYNNPVVRTGINWPSFKWAFSNVVALNWHPLTWLSLQLDYELFGLHPAGYHAINLALHIANTLVLFGLLRRLIGFLVPSALAAAFFAVHPLHVESVAWISERKDVLSTLLILLSIWCYSAYVERRRPGWYVLTLALFILSLMAKSMGVTLPLVLLLLDFWPFTRLRPEAKDKANGARPADRLSTLLVEKLPFVLVSGVFGVIAVIAQQHGGATGFGESLSVVDRLRAVPVFYVAYLWRTVWPVDLAMFYPHPGAQIAWSSSFAALFLLVCVTVASVRLRKSVHYFLVGWLWFLITLLPVIGLLQVGRQATADRYMYLPMIGLLIATCLGGYELAKQVARLRPVIALCSLVLVLACAVLSARQVQTWHDSATAWGRVVELTPPSEMAFNNYGMALAEQGRLDDGEAWVRKALTLNPTAYLPNCNLGLLLAERGELDAAVRHFEIALEQQPQNTLLLESLGQLEEERENLDVALSYYEAAEESEARSPTILKRLDALRSRMAGHSVDR